MKIILEIPKEFQEEYLANRFVETFQRVRADLNNNLIDTGGYGLAGNYEFETLEMLQEAFLLKSEVVHEWRKTYETERR